MIASLGFDESRIAIRPALSTSMPPACWIVLLIVSVLTLFALQPPSILPKLGVLTELRPST